MISQEKEVLRLRDSMNFWETEGLIYNVTDNFKSHSCKTCNLRLLYKLVFGVDGEEHEYN